MLKQSLFVVLDILIGSSTSSFHMYHPWRLHVNPGRSFEKERGIKVILV